MKKLTDIMTIVAFIGVIGVGYAYAGQIQKNTEHRWMQEYGQLKEWVKAEERDCGEDGELCNERRQEMIQGWKFRIMYLNKKLGFEETVEGGN